MASPFGRYMEEQVAQRTAQMTAECIKQLREMEEELRQAEEQRRQTRERRRQAEEQLRQVQEELRREKEKQRELQQFGEEILSALVLAIRYLMTDLDLSAEEVFDEISLKDHLRQKVLERLNS